MSYHFGKRSKEVLASCHADLQLIAEEALKCSHIDFKIVEGHRSIERQRQLYNEGKSKIDGITRKGKHNYSPSLAFDVCVVAKDADAYDKQHLCYLGGVITATAADLLARDLVKRSLRWGGNWDGDGVIIYDQRFIDLPHFELI